MVSSSQLAIEALKDRSHRAFVELLTTAETATPAWRTALAGFLTVRLVDRWYAYISPEKIALPRKEIRHMRQALRNAPSSAQRESLGHLVTAVIRHWRQPSRHVLTTMLAYGQLLQKDEHYDLAVDVYNSFLAYVDSTVDVDLMPDAYYRLGSCLRLSGQTEAAPIAYEIAHRFAVDLGDLRVRFESRMGLANVLLYRSDLLNAECVLHTVMDQLEQVVPRGPEPLLTNLRAQAIHALGIVAHYQRKYERAGGMLHQALALYQDERRREYLLADIAANCIDMGMQDAARDACLINYITGRVPHVRRLTIINLVRIAALDGHEVAFEAYRREALAMSHGPLEQAYLQLYVAEGCYRFGRRVSALRACEQAATLAQQQGLQEVREKTEALQQKMREGAAFEAAPPAPTVPPKLRPLIATLHEMRVTAGATA